jgi:hypothetical protein
MITTNEASGLAYFVELFMITTNEASGLAYFVELLTLKLWHLIDD